MMINNCKLVVFCCFGQTWGMVEWALFASSVVLVVTKRRKGKRSFINFIS